MRQRLPESAGYPLAVPGAGLVHPGTEFDCAEGLVPGCVPVEPEAPGKAAQAASKPPVPPAGAEDKTTRTPRKD